MGSCDGAEVCESVGNVILSEISLVINNNEIGIYREDDLEIGEPAMEWKKQ